MNPALVLEIESAVAELPLIDVHTHLVGGRLGARGLHDILLYHMVVSDLYAAGCPAGARLTQYPGWPDRKETTVRITQAVPFLPQICNTSSSWGVRLILRDLYGWDEPVTADALSDLYARTAEAYWGDAVHRDERTAWTWARIPHFFQSPYYVYQYATCFAAAGPALAVVSLELCCLGFLGFVLAFFEPQIGSPSRPRPRRERRSAMHEAGPALPS